MVLLPNATTVYALFPNIFIIFNDNKPFLKRNILSAQTVYSDLMSRLSRFKIHILLM